MRANSKAANSSKSLEIMDVNPQAVINEMEKHQVQWLIHGHTHRPAVHELTANEQPAFRVVLGAWHTEGSMVKVTPSDVELSRFRFKNIRQSLELTKEVTGVSRCSHANRFPCFLCYSLWPQKSSVVHHRSFQTHVFPQ
jgi:hypothetical protein